MNSLAREVVPWVGIVAPVLSVLALVLALVYLARARSYVRATIALLNRTQEYHRTVIDARNEEAASPIGRVRRLGIDNVLDRIAEDVTREVAELPDPLNPEGGDDDG